MNLDILGSAFVRVTVTSKKMYLMVVVVVEYGREVWRVKLGFWLV